MTYMQATVHDALREKAGAEHITHFLTLHGLTATPTTEHSEQVFCGDYHLGRDVYVEQKTQPLDSDRYDQIFVEVAERSPLDVRAGGLEELAEILNVPTGRLRLARDGHTGRPIKLDPARDLFSVAVHYYLGGTWTMYVDPRDFGTRLYLYDNAEIRGYCRDALLTGQLVHAPGRANPGTFGVFVPNARDRWQRHGDTWTYVGDGDEAAILEELTG